MTTTRPTLVRRRVSTAAAGLLLVALAGCATTTDGAASPTTDTTGSTTSAAAGPTLPARTRSFDVAALDPCTLLTQAQKDTFGINQPPQGPDKSTTYPGSTLCTYINSTGPDGGVGYGVSTDTARNAQSLASSSALIDIETVDGLGAVVIEAQRAGCTYVLDTSDSTNMQVGATSTGSTAAMDCPKAKAMASAVIASLTALQPG